ncbi:UNVERIFIED_CONTAM: hypothetical protein K2H54_056781 [Gekko kuhli]
MMTPQVITPSNAADPPATSPNSPATSGPAPASSRHSCFSSSFKNSTRNNRSSCSFNFYSNNMLENNLKRESWAYKEDLLSEKWNPQNSIQCLKAMKMTFSSQLAKSKVESIG